MKTEINRQAYQHSNNIFTFVLGGESESESDVFFALLAGAFLGFGAAAGFFFLGGAVKHNNKHNKFIITI